MVKEKIIDITDKHYIINDEIVFPKYLTIIKKEYIEIDDSYNNFIRGVYKLSLICGEEKCIFAFLDSEYRDKIFKDTLKNREVIHININNLYFGERCPKKENVWLTFK